MDVLLEEYLPGPEFNVGLVEGPELAPLPVAQLVYDTPKAGEWPILTYDGKWATGSAEYRASVVVCPAPVESTLSRRLSDLAVAAFRATGCRDYARVDFRLDRAGEPTILEVNPNPDIGPTAGWANAARASGRTYESAVLAVAEAALRRGAFRTS